MRSPLALIMRGLVLGYRYTLSPWLGHGCRFRPTCSEYALEAIDRHGAIGGGWLTLRRLGRCHPWGGHGFDPVPERVARPSATPLAGTACHGATDPNPSAPRPSASECGHRF